MENIIPMSYPPAQKARRSFEVIAKAKERNSCTRSCRRFRYLGHCSRPKISAGTVRAVDWAGMIPTTKRITQKFGVGARFNYIEGDMLTVNFGTGYDIAILGHILHSEGEDRSRQLLAKTFRAKNPAAPSQLQNGW